MFELNEWDEYIGDDILGGCKTKEEFVEDAIACYDPREEGRQEEKESAEREWDETLEAYKEYTSTYYEEIGRKLDGEEDNYSVCPHCGESDHFENNDYITGEYEVSCSRCCSDYEIDIEDAGYGDFTIKTIRPKCKRNEHQFIFVEESSNKYNFHRINFPYEKTNKYYCLKCGKEEYRPLNSEGKEYSKRYFKKLQRKYEEGYQPIKINGGVLLTESNWHDHDEIRINFDNGDQAEKCLESIKRGFRKSMKDIIEKEEIVYEKFSCSSERLKIISKITLRTGFSFEIGWGYRGFELNFKKIEGYINSKELLRMLNRLKKYLSSLGLEIEDKCFKKEKIELSMDAKRVMSTPWDGYNLNGKLVGRRDYKGRLDAVGIAYCESDSDCQNNVYIINGNDFRRGFKREVFEILPGIKYRDASGIREKRLLEELREASSNWDFEKAIILRNILKKEGYEKVNE